MIYDCFIFYNELDLLELRFELLDPHVDYFVLVESKKTFVGKDKPLYFKENKDRYAKWAHKIIHYVNDCDYSEEEWTYAKESPNTGGIIHWCEEFLQRESIKKAIAHINDTDVVYVSDVDEIWKPHKVGGFSKLKQLMYTYYLNNRTDEDWSKAFVGLYKDIKDESLNHLRGKNGPTTENAGWHFTNIGNAEFIKNKLENYGHQELNNELVKGNIQTMIDQNRDFIGRNNRLWVDSTDLPDIPLKFNHLLK